MAQNRDELVNVIEKLKTGDTFTRSLSQDEPEIEEDSMQGYEVLTLL